MGFKQVLTVTFLVLFFPFLTLAHEIDNKVTIHINKQGFSPNQVQINQGDMVVFENIDSNPHWPASNIHPTHGIYPEFDPKKPIKPAQSWQFKFDRAGEWRFHDHLNPSLTGTIRVGGQVLGENERESFLAKFSDNLKTLWQKIFFTVFPQALEEKFARLDLQKFDSDEAEIKQMLKFLGVERLRDKLISQSGGGAKFDCHQQAHKLGRMSYQVFKVKAFQNMDTSCHSGLIHGAMEAFLQEKGLVSLDLDIKSLCDSADTAFGRFECLHGVGHGVMAYKDYDMPQALESCQSLSDSYSQSSCFGGVFMENVMVAQGRGAILGHQTLWVSSDPYFPCNGIDQSDDVQTQCYLMQTSRMLDLTQYDFKKVADLCAGASMDLRSTCFQSLGRDAAGQTLRNPSRITEICHQVPQTYFKDCLQGGLFVIVDFWGDNMIDQPHQLCKLQDEKYKSLCYSLLTGRLPEVFGKSLEKILNTCQYFEDSYREVCLKMASS